jgi:hypothetical protein
LPFSDPAHQYRRQLNGANQLPAAHLDLQVPDLDYTRFRHTNITNDSHIATLDDEIFLIFYGHSDKIFVYSTAEMISELERLKPNTIPPTDHLTRQNMVIKRTIETTIPSSVFLRTFQVVCFHARLSGFSCKN